MKWERELSDKEQILEIRDTEPDRYYKAVIDENESEILNHSILIEGLEIDIKNAKKNQEIAEQEKKQLEHELRETSEKTRKAKEELKNEYEMKLFNLNVENQELAERERKKDIQISELQKEFAKIQEKLKKEENRANSNAKLYKAALEVGEYRDRDFAHKVKLCLENYRMSYIYGEKGYSR